MDRDAQDTVSSLLDLLLQHPLYLSIFLFGAYLVADRCRQYWRLRHFKGPFSTGISWLWHSWSVMSGEYHKWYGDATARYGPIARVAPNLLVTSSPELWAHTSAVRSPYKRAEWYYHMGRFEPGKDNVFSECDNARHHDRRKKMASGYSGKENPTLEPTIDTHVKELVHLIRSKYAALATSTAVSRPMDLATKIQYLTLDVISDVDIGKAFGDLKTNSDVNAYLKATETTKLYMEKMPTFSGPSAGSSTRMTTSRGNAFHACTGRTT